MGKVGFAGGAGFVQKGTLAVVISKSNEVKDMGFDDRCEAPRCEDLRFLAERAARVKRPN